MLSSAFYMAIRASFMALTGDALVQFADVPIYGRSKR